MCLLLERWVCSFQLGLWSTGLGLFSMVSGALGLLGLFSMVSGALGLVFSAGLVHSCSPLVAAFSCGCELLI